MHTDFHHREISVHNDVHWFQGHESQLLFMLYLFNTIPVEDFKLQIKITSQMNTMK